MEGEGGGGVISAQPHTILVSVYSTLAQEQGILQGTWMFSQTTGDCTRNKRFFFSAHSPPYH